MTWCLTSAVSSTAAWIWGTCRKSAPAEWWQRMLRVSEYPGRWRWAQSPASPSTPGWGCAHLWGGRNGRSTQSWAVPTPERSPAPPASETSVISYLNKSQKVEQGSKFSVFQRGTSILSSIFFFFFFWGGAAAVEVFSSLLINLQGIALCSQLPIPHKPGCNSLIFSVISRFWV